MTKPNRWIDALLKEAAKCNAPLPWERGAPRKALIARRVEVKAAASRQSSG